MRTQLMRHCSTLYRWGLVVGCLLKGIPTCLAEDRNEGLEFFEREVRPVLVEHCLRCHGAEKQSGGLRLDSREGVLQGGENGPVVVPGDPRQSRLVAAIRREGDLAMPPEEKLNDRQVAALVHWVEQGVPWPQTAPLTNLKEPERHWAFQPVTRPLPPDVKARDWLRTPVDAFILSRLEQVGLAPSRAADRRTLIRRATVDLTGLTPRPEEVEQFVRDPDPLAYERLIDRLLASPHFGEQWARHWLDVARYSDTKGYVYAREERFWVHAWSYRDWVVRALNDDMPYNRFVVLQIAADQAAADDTAAQAALGFLTLGRRFLGVRHDIIDDRIDVVTRGLMGLTVGCARCHNHKYDPITMRDYYALYGVFQNCVERLVPLATWDGVSQATRSGMQERETKLREAFLTKRSEVSHRIRARLTDYLQAQLELHKYPPEGFDQILQVDDILPAFVRRFRDYLARCAQQNDPIFAAWRAFIALPPDEFAARAPAVSAALAEDASVHSRVRERFREPPASLIEVISRYGQLFAEVEQEWQAALGAAQAQGRPVPEGLPDPDAEALRRVLYGPESPCEVPDESIVTTDGFFSTHECEDLWKLQGEVDRWLIQHADAPPYALVLVDRHPPMNGRVFRRGNPALAGEEVPRRFLQLLSPPDQPPFQQGSGRYELAQAIVDPRNPLTARVVVNRVWQHHFGTGLVRTPSDFGLRSEPPSHPELLDWLAARFVEEGWSLKWLHRQIMLSATYQQRSTVEKDDPADRERFARAQQLDPDNRWLWRMSTRRLSWEELCDALLMVSESWNDQIGGRPFDLFKSPATGRRTLYALVDRQYLPNALRVFDFANPDLHVPQRAETIVPQQALFLLNHPLVVTRTEALARQVEARFPGDVPEGVDWLFQRLLLRSPTAVERDAAVALVMQAQQERSSPRKSVMAWQYGYGKYNEDSGRCEGFTPLPFFNGQAWQGGPNWPDPQLGWVQLTAAGGHAGNDREHAAIRRWVSPISGRVQIASVLKHDKQPGDGIRGFLVHSRHGLLGSANLHHAQADLSVITSVEPSDTIDFVVDIGGNLNHDDFVWEATIKAESPGVDSEEISEWNSRQDFEGQTANQLSPWAQLAHVLLLTNEFFYVD